MQAFFLGMLEVPSTFFQTVVGHPSLNPKTHD